MSSSQSQSATKTMTRQNFPMEAVAFCQVFVLLFLHTKGSTVCVFVCVVVVFTLTSQLLIKMPQTNKFSLKVQVLFALLLTSILLYNEIVSGCSTDSYQTSREHLVHFQLLESESAIFLYFRYSQVSTSGFEMSLRALPIREFRIQKDYVNL